MCSLEEKGYHCTRDEMDFISHSHSRRDKADDDTLSATVNNATGLAKLNKKMFDISITEIWL